ncbi:large subunit terminase [Caudoviricetes sp.]|nr:large subunit terminase [Caudoviricetes sp.]
MAPRSAQQIVQTHSPGGRIHSKATGSIDLLIHRILGGPTLKTQQEFIFCHERRAWLTGPVGSAKTAALIASVLVPAYLYPGSRWFIARKTFWTLEQTTLKKFREALARLGPGAILKEKAGPPYQIWLAPAVKGAPPSELLFYGLDDLDKIKSMEFTGIAVDEANEIEDAMAIELDTRLRHKLPGQTAPEGPFFLRFTSNPPNRSHWLHKKFCGEEDCDPIPWGRKFRSLPNENAANLPVDYYKTIAKGMSAHQRLRLIDGECGPDVSGQPVFEDFNHDLHVGDLKVIPGIPLIRGWDFGRRRPAVVWAQLTPQGWVNRLAAMMGDNISLQSFATQVLNRSALQFPTNNTYVDSVDPHGTQERDVTELTSIKVLQQMGLKPRWRDTSIESGLELMSKGLNTLVRGRPRSMFDRVNCNLLIEGYSGGYSYPKKKDGVTAQLPRKDGYYEHPMDADRYVEVAIDGGFVKASQGVLKKSASKKPADARQEVDDFFKLS